MLLNNEFLKFFLVSIFIKRCQVFIRQFLFFPFSFQFQILKWHLTPITVTAWLNVYLQIASLDKISEDSFELPQYSSHAFVQIARVS